MTTRPRDPVLKRGAPGRLHFVLLLLLLTAPARAQQSDPSSRPTFRAGVDVVQLDVTVLDKDRHPVHGLTAADFTVVEDGAPRRVVSVEPVVLPGPDALHASWMRDVAPDVVSNQQYAGRIVTIVFDDAGTRFDPWVLGAGRRIAHDVIDSLGPADAAAVTFAFMGTKQNFTPDRAKLHAAVDSFVPKSSAGAGPPLGCAYRGRGGCLLDTLEHVADALPILPPRRKLIVLISSARFTISDLDLDRADQLVTAGATSEDLVRTFRKLQQKNISVYSFSPNGLDVSPSSSDDERLKLFAERTGGRTMLSTNAPWESVPAMFEETRSYYIVSFEAAHVDRRSHAVAVHVSRPDMEVVTRTSYVAPAAAIEKKKRPPLPPVLAAMAAGFPESGLPLETSAAVFHLPGQKQARLLLLTRVDPGDTRPDSPTVTYRATVFDKDWHDRGGDEQKLVFGPVGRASGGTVTSSVSLKPGRYELRVAAESGGRAGSLFTDLEIPDLQHDLLVVSGLLAGPARPPADLAGVPAVPIAPTVSRVFRPDEKAAAFVRVYQSGRRPRAAVEVRITIADDRGIAPVHDTRTLDVDRFRSTGAADVAYLLPLDRLGPGAHLLTIELTCGKVVVTRTMRFTVDKA